MEEKNKILVIIPTYNEALNIEKLVVNILEENCFLDVLVVDDNSPDGTSGYVENLMKKYHNIDLLKRPEKNGLGCAYIAGFKYALSHKKNYQKIIQMDADGSHDPRYLSLLIAVTDKVDVAVGSRYIDEGKIDSWNLYRKFISRMANFYVELFLREGIKDWTAGFKCFRREAIEKINFENIQSKGYLFQVEQLKKCLDQGCTVKEVPISFTERTKGKTKLGVFDVGEAFFGVLRLALRVLT